MEPDRINTLQSPVLRRDTQRAVRLHGPAPRAATWAGAESSVKPQIHAQSATQSLYSPGQDLLAALAKGESQAIITLFNKCGQTEWFITQIRNRSAQLEESPVLVQRCHVPLASSVYILAPDP